MADVFTRMAVRTLFNLTSREKVNQQAKNATANYLNVVQGLSAEEASKPGQCPKMAGVDPEMRGWSLYQILEHNVIVNGIMARTVERLALGKSMAWASRVDAKTDVLPTDQPGAEQIERFSESVAKYFEKVNPLGHLRGTATHPHPVFGPFDAHQWHCMFAFHLKLHLKQARTVATQVRI